MTLFLFAIFAFFAIYDLTSWNLVSVAPLPTLSLEGEVWCWGEALISKGRNGKVLFCRKMAFLYVAFLGIRAWGINNSALDLPTEGFSGAQVWCTDRTLVHWPRWKSNQTRRNFPTNCLGVKDFSLKERYRQNSKKVSWQRKFHNTTKVFISSTHSPLLVREESPERCQYYGEKLVWFGSNHPKLRFIIRQKWYNR